MNIQSQSSSGLQINSQVDRSSGSRGSDMLSQLSDRVSSALDKMMSSSSNAGGDNVSAHKVKEMISGIAGAPLPGMNQNSLA